jgi:hypothetical protein
MVDVLFDLGIMDGIPEHREEVVLPFFVKDVEGDVIDGAPFTLRVNAASGDEDVEVRVVMTRATRCLQNNNGADFEGRLRDGVEKVREAVMTDAHQS